MEKIILQDKINYQNTIVNRIAVRAIIINENNQLLMILTNKGDYKFPGGKVEKNEDYFQALKREVKEESGYQITNIYEEIYYLIQKQISIESKNKTFRQENHYFLATIDPYNQGKQKLDDYEAKLDFKASFVNIDYAIKKNELNLNKNPWVKRELVILRKLKEKMKI